MKKKSFILLAFSLLCTWSFSQKFEATANNLKLEVKQVEVIGDQLRINLLATNLGPDNDLSIFISDIRLFDDQGNIYKPSFAFLGDKKPNNYKIDKNLVKDIALKCQFTFTGAPATRNQISMLEISCRFANQDMKVQIKNLPIPFHFQLSTNPLAKEIDEKCLLEIKSISFDGKNVVINTLITNNDDDMEMRLNFYDCNVVDNEGNEKKCSDGSFGNGTSNYNLSRVVVKDVPIKASFQFPFASRPAEIALLKLSIGENKFIFKKLAVK